MTGYLELTIFNLLLSIDVAQNLPLYLNENPKTSISVFCPYALTSLFSRIYVTKNQNLMVGPALSPVEELLQHFSEISCFFLGNSESEVYISHNGYTLAF